MTRRGFGNSASHDRIAVIPSCQSGKQDLRNHYGTCSLSSLRQKLRYRIGRKR